MKYLNTKTAIVFGLVGLLSLLWFGKWLPGCIFLLLAGGFGLSDLQPTADGSGTSTASVLPPTRKYLAILLVLIAIALMGYDIGRDLRKITHPTTRTQSH